MENELGFNLSFDHTWTPISPYTTEKQRKKLGISPQLTGTTGP